MQCFEAAPEFIDEDNRRFRDWNPVSKEQMTAKHQALLPPDLVKGKTILDLGCCLGATGHWCLTHGAKHYTGVEVQSAYAEIAQRLLTRYHPGKFELHNLAIEAYLANPASPSVDIVCLLGVIYAFTDYYALLKASAAKAREILAIEGRRPNYPGLGEDFKGVQFINEQPINLATGHELLLGRGTLISPSGLEWILKELDFRSDNGVLLPTLSQSGTDKWHPADDHDLAFRYLMRFERRRTLSRSLSDSLQKGAGKTKPWKIE